MSNLGYFALGLGLLVVYLFAMAAVLFGAAGTLTVPMFWAYLVLFAVLCLTASAAVYLLSPDLVKERVRPGEGEQDRVTVRALNLLMFVQLLLAGLDVGRLHCVGSHLGLRIWNFASKKPSNLRISTKNILTFDGLASPLELQAGPSHIGVRMLFAPVGSSHPERR
jgi:hypothetical protein